MSPSTAPSQPLSRADPLRWPPDSSRSGGARRWLRWRRRMPWIVMSLLLAVAQGLLIALTISFESNRAQQMADAAASEAAADVRSLLLRAI